MGLFDDLFDFLKDIWNKIADGLKKIIDKIKEYLPYIIILAAVFMGFGGLSWTLMEGVVLEGLWGAATLLGAGYVLLPEEMGDAMTAVVGAVADLTTDIVEAVAPAIDAVANSLGSGLGSFLDGLGVPGMLALGVGLYFLMKSDKKERPAKITKPKPLLGRK